MSDVMIDERAWCESPEIGSGSRIGAFAHVARGARVGRRCEIGEHVTIENEVVIGDGTTIRAGVQLWNGTTIGNGVFVGPNATFTNHDFPRSGEPSIVATIVRDGASIGANATLLPGITIGPGAVVGAGAVVTGDVPPYAIVVGNPGRIVGYVNAPHPADSVAPEVALPDEGERELSIPGVRLQTLRLVRDLRGSLSAGEFPRDLPFVPKRYFLVFDVPSKYVRGEHAHRRCHQFLLCVKGSCAVMVDDGEKREEVLLNRPNLGLYMPPMIWGVQYKYSADAVLLVFASEYYDSSDYIRNYDEFVAEKRK